MKSCLYCGKALSSGRWKFCCRTCKDRWVYRNKTKVQKACSYCGEVYWGTKKFEGACCPRCHQARANSNKAGENNPAWRGGHRHYQAGKYGRDPQGLSWKVQRQLAWERDNYTCQYPGCGRGDKEHKPDCHHKQPYRVKASHELSNLVCLCKSHHKKMDRAVA